MRRILLFILLLLPLCLHAEAYYFRNYMVEMTVHANNSYSIREGMDIMFTEPRHGIYRTIPTDIWINRDVSEAQDGSADQLRNYQLKITDLKASTEMHVEDVDRCKDIRLGSSDELLSGLQHIELSYTLQMPADRIEQADLLFHSILGVGNECHTSNLNFVIHFDQPVPDASMQKLQIFKGLLGSNEVHNECITTRSPQMIAGQASDLDPNEALTIYLPLPEGYFTAETPWQSYASWLLIFCAFVVLLYVLRKELVRTTEVTPVVTFYPPKDFSSAEVGTLIDCEVDDQDLISLIPWFANQGYLSIENNNGNILLVKKKDLPDDAPGYQQEFFRGLFASGHIFNSSRPSNRNFGSKWMSTQEKLKSLMSERLNDLEWSTIKWLFFGILLTGAALVISSAVSGSFAFGVLITILYSVTAFTMLALYGEKTRYGSALITIPILLSIFFLFSGFAPQIIQDIVNGIIYEFIGVKMYDMNYVNVVSDLYVPRLAFDGLIILCLIDCILSMRLSVMTAYRRQRMGELLGLREFIKTAEEERLKILLEEDEKYFYNVLPFALAFGMADKWADKFKDLKLMPAENYPANNTLYELGRLNDTFTSSNVRHGIVAEQTARAEAAARAAARSGSSRGSAGSWGGGGGGYSGGGSGGGGSRSW